MPRIKAYTQQTTAQGQARTRRATASDFGFGDALAEVGKDFERIQQEQTNREIEDAQLKMAQARQQWSEEYLNRTRNAAPGDMSVADTMRSEMQGYFEQMGEGYQSREARRYIQLHGTSMTTGFFTRGLEFQRAKAGQYAAEQVKTATTTAQDIVGADPSQYAAVVAPLKADIKNGIGVYRHLANDPIKERLIRESVDSIAMSASASAIRDPHVRAQILGQYPSDKVRKVNEAALPDFFRELSANDRLRIVSQARRYQKQDDATARKALVATVRNHEAYITLNGHPPPASEQLSRGDFRDDAEGWEMYSAMLKAGGVVGWASEMPFKEGFEKIQELRPGDGDLSDPTYAGKVKLYDQAVKMYARRAKAIAEDQVQVAIDNDYAPGSGGIPSITTDDPTKWVDEITTRAPAVQSIAEHRELPLKVLTNQEALVMRQTIDRIPVDQQLDLMRSMSKKLPTMVTPLFDQLSPGDATLRASAGIMASPGGAIQNDENRDQAAGYILLGRNIMSLPGGKGAAGERSVKKDQLPTTSEMMDVVYGISDYDNTSIEFVKTLPDMMEAVKAHYVGKLASQGVFNFSIDDHKSEFKKSLKTVIGEPSEVGHSKVFKPWGMSENDFQESVRARVPLTYGSYGLRKPFGAPASVYEVVRAGVATSFYIDLDKPTQLEIDQLDVKMRKDMNLGEMMQRYENLTGDR
jgi:hypothetical protein